MNCSATSAPRMGLGCDQIVSAGRDGILHFVVHMGRPVSHCLLRVFLRIR